MKKLSLSLALSLTAAMVQNTQAAGSLEIYWVDVEGGGGTLIVTPAHESILIDTGWPGTRDAERIQAAAAKSGVTRIDYLVLTHFHLDHFGGAAEVSKLMPVGTIYDNGIPEHNPDGGDDEAFSKMIQPYRDLKASARRVVHPGDTIPLKQAEGLPNLVFRFLAGEQKRISPPADAPQNRLCQGFENKENDGSDNKNSVVSLIQFGSFRFFDGGDLTSNQEGALVCPINLVGPVDVYQVNHHGISISSNPLLVQSLAPTVSVMNNGARKGGAMETVTTLKSVPGLQAMFQVHRDLEHGEAANCPPEYIANLDEKCAGNFIKLVVSADTKSYTISIPGNGTKQTFRTKD